MSSDTVETAPTSGDRPDAASLARAVRYGDLRAADVVAASLERARAVQGALNAFTAIDEAGASRAAEAIDRARAAGESLPPLAGVPVVIKDMTPTAGLPTTLGSWTTDDGVDGPGGGEDAPIVARLRAAGAVVVAKSTTPEFAHSSLTSSPRHGATRNPWDPSRTCGGSSGGSAVAVATGVAPFAEGTDMGGSVRIPAGACGTVGLKPSLGRIPMTILPTPIDTISHFGPLAGSVADAVAFTAATAGPSDLDLLSQVRPFDASACAPASLEGVRIAHSPDLGYCAVSDAVRTCLERALDRLRDAGATVAEVRLPWTREALDAWLVKWGVLLAMFPSGRGRENRARMDPALVELIERGERTSALELKRTELVQASMAADMAAVMAEHDALACPTNAIEAPSVDATDADFEGADEAGRLTTFDMAHAFNMVPTYPVISLPAGLSFAGLPVGLQLVGPRYRDERLLALAGGVERALGTPPAPPSWSSTARRPPRGV